MSAPMKGGSSSLFLDCSTVIRSPDFRMPACFSIFVCLSNSCLLINPSLYRLSAFESILFGMPFSVIPRFQNLTLPLDLASHDSPCASLAAPAPLRITTWHPEQPQDARQIACLTTAMRRSMHISIHRDPRRWEDGEERSGPQTTFVPKASGEITRCRMSAGKRDARMETERDTWPEGKKDHRSDEACSDNNSRCNQTTALQPALPGR
jgi:hypothetical protein